MNESEPLSSAWEWILRGCFLQLLHSRALDSRIEEEFFGIFLRRISRWKPKWDFTFLCRCELISLGKFMFTMSIRKKGEKKKLILFLAQTTKKFNLQSRHVGVYYVINVMEKAGWWWRNVWGWEEADTSEALKSAHICSSLVSDRRRDCAWQFSIDFFSSISRTPSSEWTDVCCWAFHDSIEPPVAHVPTILLLYESWWKIQFSSPYAIQFIFAIKTIFQSTNNGVNWSASTMNFHVIVEFKFFF